MLNAVEAYNAESMPVCLNEQNRLEFTTDTILVLTLPSGLKTHRFELEGQSWDGATIPRMWWWLTGKPLSEEFRWASYWHDRLCEGTTTYEERRLADAVFLYLLSQAGVKKLKRMAMWAGVRLYGLLLWTPKEHLP